MNRPQARQTKIRKASKSSIASDYDPTPPVDQLPARYTRPQSGSWISDSIVRPYVPNHPRLSSQSGGKLSKADQRMVFLRTKLVSAGGEFFVKDKETGCWKKRKKHEAIACLLEDWSGSQTKYQITKNTIATMISGGRYLILDQTICIPGAGDFLWFGKEKCLNIWFEPVMAYKEGAINSKGFRLLLKLIWQNILGRDPESFKDIVRHIRSTTQDDATWMFQWLASQYQRPGYHLSTTLWLVGGQGTGKGTLSEIIIQLLRPSNARLVNDSELKSDWNNFINGVSLIIGDEISFGKSSGSYSMLKRYVGNSRISLRQRYNGQFSVPNITNWLLTTNDQTPLAISANDRRNTFIEGTSKPKQVYQDIAADYHALPNAEKVKAQEGFAELLASINIDDRFISEAFSTPLKQRIERASEKLVVKSPRKQNMMDTATRLKTNPCGWCGVIRSVADWCTQAVDQTRPEVRSG